MTLTKTSLQETDARPTRSFGHKYRPEIDGLRAFAVVAVIINHINKGSLPSGYLGVDVFFVISGFVITSSLSNRESKNFGHFIIGFYERRVKRLIPALAVFVLTVSLLICMFNPDPDVSLAVGKRALLGFSNIILYRQSVDYFASSTELNPFTHTWSLGVEEQFYFIFPFLIWFSGFGRQAKHGARNLFVSMGVLMIPSLMSFIYLYNMNLPAAYFLMPPRFWEMAAGCLVFLGVQKKSAIRKSLERIPPVLVVAGLIGILFLPQSAAVPATILIVVLTAVLIACIKSGTLAFQFFTINKIVYIGLISYPLYLWHWGVLSISRWTIGIHWWSLPFQVALILLLAIVSYRWVESPLRKRPWLGRQGSAIASGVGILGLTMSALWVLGKPLQGRLYVGRTTIVPGQLVKYSRPAAPDLSCNIFSNTLKSVDLSIDCGVTHSDELPTIYVLGDSHAKVFGQSLSAFSGESKDFNVITIWGNYCMFPAAVNSSYDHPYLQGKDCYALQDKVSNKLLSELTKGDIVVIASFSIDQFVQAEKNPFTQQDLIFTAAETGAILKPPEAQQAYFNEVELFISTAISKGAKVYFYVNGGRYFEKGYGIQQCAGNATWNKQWFQPFVPEDSCYVDKSTQFSKYRKQFAPNLSRLAQLFDQDILIDAYSTGMCGQDKCNGAYTTDGQHLQEWASGYLMNKLLQRNNLYMHASNDKSR